MDSSIPPADVEPSEAARHPRKSDGGLREPTAFTLIELIGVLAIMAIIAGVMLPNVLHSIELAAVKAEGDTMSALADQVKLYTRQKGALPPAATWTTALSTYADIPATQIATNKRQINRMYVIDPTAPRQRVLMLSTMRSNLTLPNAATVSANFQGIWDTPDHTIPPGFGAVWSQATTNIDYLVIQRVNLVPSLQTFSIPLKNNGSASVNYQIVNADGTTQAAVPIATGATAAPALISGQSVRLYNQTGQLNYTYVVNGAGRSIDFNGTNWIPQ